MIRIAPKGQRRSRVVGERLRHRRRVAGGSPVELVQHALGAPLTGSGRDVADFRELVELLPVVVYEAEPGPAGRTAYISPQVRDLLGYDAEELIADPGLRARLIHPDDREREIEREREQQRLPREAAGWLRSEYRMIDRAGHTVWVRDLARLTCSAEGLWYRRGVLIDITGERDAEALDGDPPDVLRLSCPGCGLIWAAAAPESCPSCGAQKTAGVSLNSALGELAAARQRVEKLLLAVREHLGALDEKLNPELELAPPATQDAPARAGSRGQPLSEAGEGRRRLASVE